MMANPAPLRTSLLAAAAVAGLFLGTAAVWNSTSSAFTGSTSNSANSFGTGTVTLSDNDAGAALFSATNLGPGSTQTACILVTYSGTLNPTGVRLYGSNLAGTGLGSYLDLVIEEGTGTASTGVGGSCTGFSPTSTLHSATLANFATNRTGYANGLSAWAPTSAGGTKAYRFTYTVQNNTSAQSLTCSISFVWESQR